MCWEHGIDREPDCEECADLGEEEPDTIEPAVWTWHVIVETLSGGEPSMADLSVEVMTTRMDPREVAYEVNAPPR